MIRDVLVVGAGAVGGYFGAYLAQAGVSTSFLLRGRTLAVVQQQGLIVREPGRTLTLRPRADSDAVRLPAPDLIVLAIKAHDLDAAMDAIAPVVTPHTVILTLQNGIDTEARVAQRLNHAGIVSGVAYISSRVVEPGTLDVARKGSIAIGEVAGGTSARVQSVADLFASAGVSCHDNAHMPRIKWEKMCWNCVCNPLTVLLNADISAAVAPHRRPLVEMIVAEVAAVAAASGVTLRHDMAEQVVLRCQGLEHLHTSMYEDWRAGRQTEIDHLNGFVVRQGQALGIATPVNELLAASVAALSAAQALPLA